jgi:hypothetical protein
VYKQAEFIDFSVFVVVVVVRIRSHVFLFLFIYLRVIVASLSDTKRAYVVRCQ